jgi:hypothetical protein
MQILHRLRVRLYYLAGYAEGRYGWLHALLSRLAGDGRQ